MFTAEFAEDAEATLGNSQAIGDSGDAVLQQFDIEVDEQAQTLITEFQVRKQLGLMNLGNNLYRLKFNDDAVLDEKVEAIAGVDSKPVVDQRQLELSNNAVSTLPQLVFQASLVRGLKQTGLSARCT